MMENLEAFGLGKVQDLVSLLDSFQKAGIRDIDAVIKELSIYIDRNKKDILKEAEESMKIRGSKLRGDLPTCPKCGQVMVNGCAVEELVRVACEGCGYSKVVG